eukprot:gene5607-6174_t
MTNSAEWSPHRLVSSSSGKEGDSPRFIRKVLSQVQVVLDLATSVFPFWVLAFSLLGASRPQTLQWFTPYITPALAATMIGMGMTLTLSDFRNVFKSWRYVLVGFLAQYSIMPLAAVASTRLFSLPPDLASGLILVGCAPGGTASNVVTMIAKADLALSILMTAASTVAAVVMTPFLTTLLSGSLVRVNPQDLVVSTLSVVLLPVLLGVGLNTALPNVSNKLASVTPFLSVILVALICGSVSAANSAVLTKMNSIRLFGAVVTLHAVGFALGYVFAKLLKANDNQARTISIETGMQNSALAVVLSKHFPNAAVTALPGSISATVHSILGSTLAAFWRIFCKKDTTAGSTNQSS